MEVLNLDLTRIGSGPLTGLQTMYAQDIAEVLAVTAKSIVDLSGHNASTTLEPRASNRVSTLIEAYTVVPEGSSANALAEQLYSSRFRSQILGSTIQVLAQHSSQDIVSGPLSVPTVAIKLERFIPPPPPTTRTTTETQTNTGTSTSTNTPTSTQLPELSSSRSTTAAGLHEDLHTTASVAFLATTGMEGLSEKGSARGAQLLPWSLAVAIAVNVASA